MAGEVCFFYLSFFEKNLSSVSPCSPAGNLLDDRDFFGFQYTVLVNHILHAPCARESDVGMRELRASLLA
jgi:hypothetical protein